jgi:hypothetical protein
MYTLVKTPIGRLAQLLGKEPMITYAKGAVHRNLHLGVRRLSSANKDESAATVVFLRHGQSIWNQQNIFIGWYPTLVSLTAGMP